MSFDDQFKALIFYHLEEFSSGTELLQAFEQNDFAKECVAPPKGISKASFFEARSCSGLQVALEHRDLLRLVETPPEGVPPDS